MSFFGGDEEPTSNSRISARDRAGNFNNDYPAKQPVNKSSSRKAPWGNDEDEPVNQERPTKLKAFLGNRNKS